MKITFMRHGFANNSSSAHSLIFSRSLKKEKAAGMEFGWDNFCLSSKENKKKYLLVTLYSNYTHYNRFNDTLINHDTVNKFIRDEFVKFVRAENLLANIFTEADVEEFMQEKNAYIDHQSLLSMPIHRNANKWNNHFLNIEFFADFCNEIINNDFVILGGNDNSDGNRLRYEDTNEYDSIKELWRFLKDKGENSIICEKDHKTGEYVISYMGGTIMKVSMDGKADGEKSEFPYLVDIAITSKCEAGCAFCYMDSKPDGKHAEYYDLDYLANALKEANVFEIVLGGGEPTEYRGQYEYHNIASVAGDFRGKGFKVGITTKNYEVHTRPYFKDLVCNLNSMAVSCCNVWDLDTVKIIKDAFETANHEINSAHGDYRSRCFSVQCVLESNTLEELKEFLTKCYYLGIYNVTLLGAKSHGRGKDFKWKKMSKKWIEVVGELVKEKNLDISVDSVLSQKYRKELVKYGIKPYFLTGEEGRETCFIDAVNGKLCSSSFCREKSVKIDMKRPTKENILKAYAQV